jgi:phospholipid/cholesterol/gamma-HCH transport system permease protein
VRPSLGHDPRTAAKKEEPSWLFGLGAWGIGRVHALGAIVRTLATALASWWTPGSAARAVIVRVMLAQVMFTGFQAISVISVVALSIGATIIIQIHLLAPAMGGELLGQILVTVVLREMAPLGTAFLVAGRSGTAIATELGRMKVGQEVLALASLGIDPPRYIVLPRVVGVVVSVFALMAYFIVVGIAGGYLVGWLITEPSFDAVRMGVARALVIHDIPFYLVKGLGLGVLVGWLCCHYGLSVQVSPTEVPQKAGRAVMLTLLCCVIFNTLVTIGFYALVGPPVSV